MTVPLHVGIAGLGTVGMGVANLLADNAALLAERAGRPIVLAAVSARDRNRDRGPALAGIAWAENAAALATHPGLDVVVEVIGGEDGPARALVEASLAAGRHVVTANKALLAHHGLALAAKAEKAGRVLAFEAAVAGGIPIVKGLSEGLVANAIDEVHGILNGTCNYILTEMETSGATFDAVLAEAQRLGYAEADPSFDIDGIDTAHKLCLLTALAFGTRIDFAAVHIEGIRRIEAADIAEAHSLGYRIKLLGIARLSARGVEQRVHPCMVPLTAPMAAAAGALNAVVASGRPVDKMLFVGRGAGAGPTASAIVADLVDIARGRTMATFGRPVDRLAPLVSVPLSARVGGYYLRLAVVDRPGVIADVSAILKEHRVSLEQLLQRRRDPGEAVPVMLTTHDTLEADMAEAVARIAALDSVVAPPRLIRIEQF